MFNAFQKNKKINYTESKLNLTEILNSDIIFFSPKPSGFTDIDKHTSYQPEGQEAMSPQDSKI